MKLIKMYEGTLAVSSLLDKFWSVALYDLEGASFFAWCELRKKLEENVATQKELLKRIFDKMLQLENDFQVSDLADLLEKFPEFAVGNEKKLQALVASLPDCDNGKMRIINALGWVKSALFMSCEDNRKALLKIGVDQLEQDGEGFLQAIYGRLILIQKQICRWNELSYMEKERADEDYLQYLSALETTICVWKDNINADSNYIRALEDLKKLYSLLPKK